MNWVENPQPEENYVFQSWWETLPVTEKEKILSWWNGNLPLKFPFIFLQ